MDRAHTGTLDQLLAEVDARPTMAAYHEAARRLDSGPDMLKPVRIALLASFTVEPVVPFLRVEAARHGFRPEIYIGPYNSIDQELLWSDSGCARHMADVVFISYTLADACPRLSDDFLSLSCSAVDGIVEEVVGRIGSAVAAFRARSTAPVVVTNFAPSRSAPHGLYEPMVERSQTDAIHRLNARLARRLKSIDGAYVFDFHAIASDLGRRQWFDAKLWHLARAPLSAAGLAAVARRQAIFLRALLTPPRKCLVLDLDNTLWGGVLGEVGAGGIKLGATYPGSVYREFQGVVRQLQRRGVLLAINSKNNQTEADEVLAGHPDMVLRPEDFAAARINWDPKPENMIAIARELNIGLDSMVFFDDSPSECSLMR
jgi:HAD superfamily phosphatase (TIGR01681 family)